MANLPLACPTRRTVLAAMGAAPVAALPSSSFDSRNDADAGLLQLWRSALDRNAKITERRSERDRLEAQLPEWARPGLDDDGETIHEPEWPAALLKEHGIPPEIGRRPSFADLGRLNATLKPRAIESKARLEAFQSMIAKRDEEERRVGLTALQQSLDDLIDEQLSDFYGIATTPASSVLGALVKLSAWFVETVLWVHGPDFETSDLDGERLHVLTALTALEAAFPEFASLVNRRAFCERM